MLLLLLLDDGDREQAAVSAAHRPELVAVMYGLVVLTKRHCLLGADSTTDRPTHKLHNE